jgi:hypothetical protein
VPHARDAIGVIEKAAEIDAEPIGAADAAGRKRQVGALRSGGGNVDQSAIDGYIVMRRRS